MAPIIHCVRHAQGFHNLSIAAHSIYDPMLTPFGEQQCRELQHDFPHHDRVELIVASPLRRTMYTALISFEDTIKRKNLTVVALPETQETSDLPCDTGSSPEDLASEFASKPADLSLVGEGWNNKRGRWAPTAQAIEDRAKATREWLMARPEKEIVLVTHGKSSIALESENVRPLIFSSRRLPALLHPGLGRLREVCRYRLGQYRVPQLRICRVGVWRSDPGGDDRVAHPSSRKR